MGTSTYTMELDLRILDHLGIRLYSNAAAVLSEAVANAWDAEATNVVISISPNEIVIQDDGNGMALEDVNGRFLRVGYDKRHNEGGQSPTKRRKYMGRKGIGKLALFSIANVVEVYTLKEGGRPQAFRMETDAIKQVVQNGGAYNPTEINAGQISKGTKIVLTSLTKKRVKQTEAALKKRIARRFSVIGQVGTDVFNVTINDESICHHDRDDLQAVEFLWEFGEAKSIETSNYSKIVHHSLLEDGVNSLEPTWLVKGWMGTAQRPKDLVNEDSGTMNCLVVMARGRLIQENILDKLGFNMILANYLTGQIEADFLDDENLEDIATSDRQRLIEDDPRYESLKTFLRARLVEIGTTWSQLRNEQRGKEVVEEHPALKDWMESLPSGQQEAAKKTLGVIKSVELENENDRTQRYRSGVLAFERLRLQEASHNLGNLPSLSADKLLPLMADLSSMEAALYVDIVKSRLEVIGKFESLVDANEKERVIQEHVFKNMWLLDPGWERADGSERMEQRLKSEFEEFADGLSEDQSKGRLDIRYRTNAGQHIIVELKRANRKLQIWELQQQGEKYKSGLRRCLTTMGEINPHISIVFILGQPIATDFTPKEIEDSLKGMNGRVVYYDEMIAQAQNSYQNYINKSKDLGRIERILEKMV